MVLLRSPFQPQGKGFCVEISGLPILVSLHNKEGSGYGLEPHLEQ